MSYLHGPLALPLAAPRPLLACGAGGRLSLCLASGATARLLDAGDEPPFGAVDRLRVEAEGLRREAGAGREPELLVHDRDPLLPGSSFARRAHGIDRLPVDHHVAHAAGLLAEHGERDEAVVVVLDGGGLGPDGTIWGGELLAGSLGGRCAFDRAGLLFPVRLPGGTGAGTEPWEMCCAWLAAAFETDDPPRPGAIRIPDEQWEGACERIRTGLDSPLTTSAGRLLQAVGALAGVAVGPAGAALPAAPAASIRPSGAYPAEVIAEGGAPLIVDPRPAVRAAAADAGEGVPAEVIGARLRIGIARALADGCERAAAGRGTTTVGLTGDTAEDAELTRLLAAELRDRGLRVLLPARVPGHDGGIALGQAALAIAAMV